jgi:hypothetical protein
MTTRISIARKIIDWVTRTSLKGESELLHSFCSTSGIRHVTLPQNQVLCHEGKEKHDTDYNKLNIFVVISNTDIS